MPRLATYPTYSVLNKHVLPQQIPPKNHISCKELWTDEDFEIIAVEVNSRNHNYTWKILGLYRARNDDMRILES